MDWRIKQKAPEDFLFQFPELNPVISSLLYNRGIKDKEKIEQFLDPDYYRDLHDPFLMLGMEKAVERISKALNPPADGLSNGGKEKIVVFGDYDADGVSASALVVQALELFGADVSVYIPDRAKEGYGLNLNAVREIIEQKASLIVTVDCGISNSKEVDFAQKNGVDVIITDHHSITQEIPKAFAVIDPKQENDAYPFKDLAGVGVAYKLVCGLLSSVETRQCLVSTAGKDADSYLKWCLDIVALGTVADVCPLIDENRTIVKFGLMVLEKNRRIGLAELLKTAKLYDGESKLSLNSHNIGYQIGPRLNASGRMDHANTSYQLLITKSEIEARSLAAQIEEKNIRRQNLTKQIIDKIKAEFDFFKENFVFASLAECPAGIAGLVAGKLCDEFAKPAFIISKKEDKSKGSCRAPEYLSEKGFHLGKLLSECKNELEEFGGHAQAAGFSIKTEHIPAFEGAMRKIFAQKWEKEIFGHIQSLQADHELSADDISWNLLDAIKQFAPFGEGNPQPLFVLKSAPVQDVRFVGNGEKHLKLSLRLSRKDGTINYAGAIAFGFGSFEVKAGDLVDLAFYLEENKWNGNRSLQLRISDIKKASL